MINNITASDIDDWAKKEPRRSQEILPQLIIRLILASSTKIGTFNFPIEKGIQFSGYDGVLVSSEQTNFFPLGKSVWEFGTNKNARKKFEEDIEKRSKEPLGVTIPDTIFIFATLKIWNHIKSIEELINDSKNMYNWKDIIIIDASKIMLWLEQCPAVSVWFSTVIEKNTKGLISLEMYWEDNCLSTKPNLNKDFFLFGRETQVELLIKWFENANGYRLLKSESTHEATLFIIATILSMTLEEREKVLSRSIIVTSTDAWDEIIKELSNNIILIPIFNFTESIYCPKNITAILPVNRFSPISKISKNILRIELPKYSKIHFNNSLKLIGFNSDECSKIESETKRSFLPFYRQIAQTPNMQQPKWSIQPNIKELIPAMFIVGWNSNYQGDRSIIEILSGMSYEEYMKILTGWMSMEDAPIFNVVDNYQVVSVQELWNFLFDKISNEEILKFKDCVINIFKIIDPTFELPKESWYLASFLGKKMEYSYSFLQGIIISLILLAEKDDENNHFGIMSTNNWVYSIIKEILTSVDSWQHWNTIAAHLPLLAEASPKAITEKLEEEIRNEDAEIWKLFTISEDSFWGMNYYTDVIWTLENLVWSEVYAVRAIIVLAKISEKNFEYKMASSPSNSLYEIFCIWNPQSTLDYESRMQLIERICTLYPSTGWNLLNSILPSVHGTCGVISKSRWTDIKSTQITNKEYFDSIEYLIFLCLNIVSANIEQWTIIISKIDLFQNHFKMLKKKCIECCKSFSETKMLLISDILREQISKFRKFRDADWSVSEEYVLKLEKLLYEVSPDSILKYSYLFKDHPNLLNPIPYDKDTKSDFAVLREKVFQLRNSAIKVMLQDYGIEAILLFCEKVKDTRDLGVIIANTLLCNNYDFNLLIKIKHLNSALYSSTLWALLNKNGINILIDVLNTNKCLSAEEKGEILCYTHSSVELWDQINTFEKEVVDFYWENIIEYQLLDLDSSSYDYFIKQLLKYNRAFSSVKSISCTDCSNTQLIIETLEKCTQCQFQKEKCGVSIKSIDQHEIYDLFKKIYENENVDENILVKLEIFFLPYFANFDTPKYLIRHIEKNPEEFMYLASKLHKPDVTVELHSSQCEQSDSNMAKEILKHFIKIPGCNNEVTSEDVFREWHDRVQKYAKEIGYTKAYELRIGKLLSYSPVGIDGIFPHEIVRNFFEVNESSTILNEFITEKYNQQDIFSGTSGLSEMKIAEQYEKNSLKLRIKYPITATILSRIGESYFRDARYEQQKELMNFQ